MAERKKRAAKSENITLRLDPQTRFKLDFIARLKGQTLTTVVERAIAEAADRATFFEDEEQRSEVSWKSFWHIEEGVRSLTMAPHAELFPSYEDQRRRDFAEKHWPFFWKDKGRWNVRVEFVEILWPRIDEFIEMHDQGKSEDYFAAGKAMQEALATAGVNTPLWPQPSDQLEKASIDRGPTPAIGSDINDDIPF